MSAFEHTDLEAARKKLRDLTEVACRVLDAKSLTIISFHIAMHLISANDQTVRTRVSEDNPAPSNVIPFKPVP